MCVKVWLINIKAVILRRLIVTLALGLTKLFIQTSAIYSRTLGELDSKLVFEDGGEIDKNTKQNISINYEKIFTLNFCLNADSAQRAGGGG